MLLILFKHYRNTERGTRPKCMTTMLPVTKQTPHTVSPLTGSRVRIQPELKMPWGSMPVIALFACQKVTTIFSSNTIELFCLFLSIVWMELYSWPLNNTVWVDPLTDFFQEIYWNIFWRFFFLQQFDKTLSLAYFIVNIIL